MSRWLSWPFGTETAQGLDLALPWVFVLCALPVMIFIAITVPPGQSPDEIAHAIRAASVVHFQIVGARGKPAWARDHYEEQLNVMADLGTATVAWRSPTADQYYGAATQAYVRATPWSGRLLPANVANTGTYPPFLYVPAAIAFRIAHRLRGSPYDAFIAARCADAVCYALLGLLGLVLARRGKLLLFTVLVLPPALWLGGTLHPDGLMIGLAVLSAALLSGAEQSRARLWLAAAALAFVILARPPLIPLALFIALPLGPRRSVGPFLLASLPGLFWILIVVPHVAVPFYSADASPAGPLWIADPSHLFGQTNPAIQARILLSHPGRLLTLPVATILTEWKIRLGELVGVVGTLNVRLPQFIWTLGFAALIAALVGFGRDPANARLKSAIPICAATILLLYDAQYMSWTHVGDALIQGIQGRYFLELLPFLALAAAPRPARPIWALPAIILAACDLAAVPWTILQAYYVK